MTNQQLKAHCEDVIANPQDHRDWVVDMARVALASLKAEPFAYADVKAVIRMLKGDTRFFTAFQEESKTKRVAMFTDPPVTELKPIELPQLISSWEGDDVISGRNRGITDCAEALRKQGYEVKS